MPIEITENGKDIKGIPNYVRTHDQLSLLPEKYLSDDSDRPLLLTTSPGQKFTYALRPVLYSALDILVIEAMERLSYYSINSTQTNYLIGEYSPMWNANMIDASATQFVQGANALTYTIPLVGGIRHSCLRSIW